MGRERPADVSGNRPADGHPHTGRSENSVHFGRKPQEIHPDASRGRRDGSPCGVEQQIRTEEAGVDAIVAEGFEAGGHNGREETTTLTLIPQVRRATGLPVVAAGGIGSGEAMLAAMALGAEGVQIGTLFALSAESSASEAFKQRCLALDEGGTMLCLKKLSPTRLVRNGLFDKVAEAEARGANSEELRDILGKAASKRGIFEGDTEQGELEIGQIASSVNAIRPAGDIVRQLVEDFRKAQKDVAAIGF